MARILVVGSVARDEVILLRTPMREGAHLEGTRAPLRVGGGGANTAIALARAGHDTGLVAAVGDDDLADGLLAELQAAGLDTRLVSRIDGPSTHSLIFVDPDGERTIVNLTRARPAEPPRLAGRGADALYVRSKATNLADVLAEAAAEGLVVAHMPPLLDGARPAQVLVASESDLPPEALADPFATGRRVAGERLRWVVITRGPAGATAFGPDGAVIEAEAPLVTAVDSTGAGDAFAGGLVHALVSGRAMAQALDTACAWGAESVRWEASSLPPEAVAGLA